MLKERCIELIATAKPDAFLDGAVGQFEKAMLVSKPRGARDRKRATGVKVEGRPSLGAKYREATALARQLVKGGLSYREIAAELFSRDYNNMHGRPFSPSSIMTMLLSD